MNSSGGMVDCSSIKELLGMMIVRCVLQRGERQEQEAASDMSIGIFGCPSTQPR
jgi:hypothetical protein